MPQLEELHAFFKMHHIQLNHWNRKSLCRADALCQQMGTKIVLWEGGSMHRDFLKKPILWLMSMATSGASSLPTKCCPFPDLSWQAKEQSTRRPVLYSGNENVAYLKATRRVCRTTLLSAIISIPSPSTQVTAGGVPEHAKLSLTIGSFSAATAEDKEARNGCSWTLSLSHIFLKVCDYILTARIGLL